MKETEKKDLLTEEPETESAGKEKEEKKVDVNELIEKGKKGNLSSTDLDEAMESMDYDMDSLERLYAAFEDNGVSLPDGIFSH